VPRPALFLLLLAVVGCRRPFLDWVVVRPPERPPLVLLQCSLREDCLSAADRICRYGFDVADGGFEVRSSDDSRALEAALDQAWNRGASSRVSTPRW